VRLEDLQAYSASGRCGACWTADAEATYMTGEVIRSHLGDRTPGFPLLDGLNAEDAPALMYRECRNCGYSWWEIPLNSHLVPDESDHVAMENSALRRLIVAITREIRMDLEDFSPGVREGMRLVVQYEDGTPDPEEQEAVKRAAPYFAPLRKD
jgi:hypothetical protein